MMHEEINLIIDHLLKKDYHTGWAMIWGSIRWKNPDLRLNAVIAELKEINVLHCKSDGKGNEDYLLKLNARKAIEKIPSSYNGDYYAYLKYLHEQANQSAPSTAISIGGDNHGPVIGGSTIAGSKNHFSNSENSKSSKWYDKVIEDLAKNFAKYIGIALVSFFTGRLTGKGHSQSRSPQQYQGRDSTTLKQISSNKNTTSLDNVKQKQ